MNEFKTVDYCKVTVEYNPVPDFWLEPTKYWGVWNEGLQKFLLRHFGMTSSGGLLQKINRLLLRLCGVPMTGFMCS